eukprot:NODE_112_length_19362_cov_0.399678.p2 type:complete len:1172 gc:universal NODE_112_length_19362_cov_0.399678:13353-9838(-)
MSPLFFELKEAKHGKIASQKSEKSKTVAVIIAMCLNLGISPPDMIKPEDSAKLLCWQIPKNSDTIIRNLQLQYQLWHPRAKYKLLPDPSLEDLKKVCVALRKAAKHDRILIHYNGYGVPQPTQNGEIWVFNKQYTQYLPVSLHDLQHWTQSPSIFVWDCSHAGNLLKAYKKFAHQKDVDSQALNLPKFSDNIQFAACQSNEQLSLHPDVPADFFTSCLTTPIIVALRCWVLENKLRFPNINIDSLVEFPGKLNDRKTPLGELNWIFTAVVDTIAWSLFPRDDFKKLFRNDLLVAALYRNFLLAQRLMRQFGCSPVCDPPISIYAYRHHLWGQWDLVLDQALRQINSQSDPSIPTKINQDAAYTHSLFFSDQLTAFEIWLEQRSKHVYKSPEQLPILLQVLLSQAHRSRALILLAKFLDLGAWAINEALSVGIFPYCLKLLQSPAPELRAILAFIWARLLSIESDFQNDIVKDGGYLYFFQGLSGSNNCNTEVQSTEFDSLYTTNCAFVLSQFVINHAVGKDLCFKNGLVPLICRQFQYNMNSLDPEVISSKEWLLYALSAICHEFQPAIQQAMDENCTLFIIPLLSHKIPRIRAAALNCLHSLVGLLMNSTTLQCIGKALYLISDLSVLCRYELLSLASRLLCLFPIDVNMVIHKYLSNPKATAMYNDEEDDVHNSLGTLESVWKSLLIFTEDPHDPIKELAQKCLDAHLIKYTSTLQNIIDDFEPNTLVKQVISLSNKPILRKTRSFADSLRQFTMGKQNSREFNISSVIHEKLQYLHIKPQSFDYCSKLMISTLDSKYTVDTNKQQLDTCSFLLAGHLKSSRKSLVTDKFNLSQIIPIDYKCDGIAHHSSINVFASYSRSGNTYLYGDVKHVIEHDNKLANSIFVNQNAQVMILNSLTDGSITVYKCLFDNLSNIHKVHGSRPLTDVLVPNGLSKVLTEWHEQSGKLYMTGSCKIIRIFDMNSELKSLEIHSRSHHDVSSFSIDNDGSLLLCGFGDGMVRLFDVRCSTRDSLVFSSRSHSARLIETKLQKYGRHVLTGSEDGNLKIWDIRAMSLPLINKQYNNIISVDMHDVLPLVSISQPNGVLITSIKEWEQDRVVNQKQSGFLNNNANLWIHSTNQQDMMDIDVIKQYSGVLGPRVYNDIVKFATIRAPTLYVGSKQNISIYSTKK